MYKYHHCKSDTPIKEDRILANFYEAIISGYNTGIFKYETNNQECIVHIGRYCRKTKKNAFKI